MSLAIKRVLVIFYFKHQTNVVFYIYIFDVKLL